MGIACTMGRVVQKTCAQGRDTPPPPPPTCFMFHPDPIHDMTWIVDEVPPTWVLPVTFAYSDGLSEVSTDGTDAHEFAVAGTYTISGTDAEGRTCVVTVEVPH